MRIAIDVRPVRSQRAGIGIYTKCLVNSLAGVRTQEEFLLMGAADTRWDLLPSGSGFSQCLIEGHPLVWHLRAARWASKVDLYHSPSSLFVPWMVPHRSVVTVHDLVPFRMGEVSSAKTWWTHRIFTMTIKRVRGVIAVSAFTAQDLRSLIPGLRTPVATILEAPRPGFTVGDRGAAPIDAPRGYYLAVGTLEPRKNLPLLLRAYRQAVAREPALPDLVIAGKTGWKNEEVEAMLRDPAFTDRVRLIGYVSDERLLTLFRNTVAFVYPSRYEGFGLPVLEAMACGAPVITSTSSSLPEVAGDAAILVDPNDESALCEQLLRLRDPALRDELAHRGTARASQFSWDATARETLALYQRLSRG